MPAVTPTRFSNGALVLWGTMVETASLFDPVVAMTKAARPKEIGSRLTSTLATISLAAMLFATAPLSGQVRSPDQYERQLQLLGDTVVRARGVGVTDQGKILFEHGATVNSVTLARTALPPESSSLREAAISHLSNRIVNRSLTIAIEGMSSDARVLSGSDNVAVALVKEGLAYYCNGNRLDSGLQEAHEYASSRGIGLWAEDNHLQGDSASTICDQVADTPSEREPDP
ncbi:MAG: hypothetical protein AAGK22_26070 [Acidobacteriota bacterium]